MTKFKEQVTEALRVALREAAGRPFDQTPTMEDLADRIAPRVAAAIEAAVKAAVFDGHHEWTTAGLLEDEVDWSLAALRGERKDWPR